MHRARFPGAPFLPTCHSPKFWPPWREHGHQCRCSPPPPPQWRPSSSVRTCLSAQSLILPLVDCSSLLTGQIMRCFCGERALRSPPGGLHSISSFPVLPLFLSLSHSSESRTHALPAALPASSCDALLLPWCPALLPARCAPRWAQAGAWKASSVYNSHTSVARYMLARCRRSTAGSKYQKALVRGMQRMRKKAHSYRAAAAGAF